MAIETVRVSNLPLRATKQDIVDFFSFSGEIQHIDLQREGDRSQIAYVTFKDHESLDTALLLSGAKIVNQSVTIVPVEGHIPSQDSDEHLEGLSAAGDTDTEEKAKTLIANVLAKSYLLGKDAMNMAKAFDQKHQISAQASATVSNLDKNVGISEKVKVGTSTLNQGVRTVDEKFQVSEKTKVALSAAEQTLQSAGSALLKNKYIFTGATWVTGAFSKVAKAANDVSQKTKEKVQISEMERREQANNQSFGAASHHDMFADHLDEDDMAHYHTIPDSPAVPLRSEVHY
ncbi:hypothetical protein O6H91_12G021600 [Diphasiastrum complanatum]|uniref:Uncharacterized protein n=1 Tax=Diphasiastrum complanatum TaxID=34168 RepID=A0ACC2BZG9_DIPCM|nr:hypothetical protein O6H91_12G021600 [Diphasiastrum complanatum]